MLMGPKHWGNAPFQVEGTGRLDSPGLSRLTDDRCRLPLAANLIVIYSNSARDHFQFSLPSICGCALLLQS